MTTPIKYNSQVNKLSEFTAGDVIPVHLGGTGAGTAEGARTQLQAASDTVVAAHINDESLHPQTPADLGAVSQEQFVSHLNNTSNPHSVTAAQVGAPTVAQMNSAITASLAQHATDTGNPHQVTASQIGAATQASLAAHTQDFSNPHQVTALQLGAVEQTDFVDHLNASNPHQITPALIGAASSAQLAAHVSNTSNPHSVTPVQIGAATQVALQQHTTNTSNPHSVTAAQVGALPTSSRGSANGVAPLDGAGKLPVQYLPAAAIPDFYVVANAAARLALSVQEGDEVVQTDDGSQWIFDGASWFMRPRPADGVTGPTTSVNNEIALFDGVTGKVLKGGSGLTNTAPGALNGRNVSADGVLLDSVKSTLDSHTGNTSNPHSVTAAQVGSYTKGEVDTLLQSVAPQPLPMIELSHTTAPASASSTLIIVPYNTWDVLDSTAFTFSVGLVTVKAAGFYDIDFTTSVKMTTNGAANVRGTVLRNGVVIPKSQSFAYVRSAFDGYATVSHRFRVTLAAGDQITVGVESFTSYALIGLVQSASTLSITKVQ